MYKKREGLAQIPLMIGLLIMAVALPLTAKVTQQNTENRSKAAEPVGIVKTNSSETASSSTMGSTGLGGSCTVNSAANPSGGCADAYYCRVTSYDSSSRSGSGTCEKRFCTSNGITRYVGETACGVGDGSSLYKCTSAGNNTAQGSFSKIQGCATSSCRNVGSNSAECTCKDSYSGLVRDPGNGVCGTSNGYQNSLYICQTNGSWGSAITCGHGCQTTSNSAECKNAPTPSQPSCTSQGGTCRTGTGCGSGYTYVAGSGCGSTETCCKASSVSPQCTSDLNCPDHEICSSGKCVASHDGYACSRDTQCLSGSECINGKCAKSGTGGCTSDLSCPDYQICSSGKCVASHDGYACSRDTQCLSTSKCINGKCAKPVTPTPAPSYTCTSKGGYCTLSTNKHIGVFAKAIDGTCATGQTCVGCMPASTQCIADPAEPGTYKMNTGGPINTSNGSGCWKTCTPGTPTVPVTPTITTAPTNTCTSNGGYCTGADNQQIGTFIKEISGTCATGQKCVQCMPNNNQCVKDPADQNSYKMTTGGQINTSNGSGCWKTCDPTSMNATFNGANSYWVGERSNNGDDKKSLMINFEGTVNATGGYIMAVRYYINGQEKLVDLTTVSNGQINMNKTSYDFSKDNAIGKAGNNQVKICVRLTPVQNYSGQLGDNFKDFCTNEKTVNVAVETNGVCSVCTSFDTNKANGDFNCDGKVNLVDFSIWKTLYNNSCGKVTLNDFSVWKSKFINQ